MQTCIGKAVCILQYINTNCIGFFYEKICSGFKGKRPSKNNRLGMYLYLHYRFLVFKSMMKQQKLEITNCINTFIFVDYINIHTYVSVCLYNIPFLLRSPNFYILIPYPAKTLMRFLPHRF